MNPDDAQLVRNFVQEHKEQAFAQLVQRYLPMVYSSALRQVGGDCGVAADVAQSVFIALARKAPSLQEKDTLAPWLHKATRLEALTALRSGKRRVARETEAASMNQLNYDEAAADWETLRPVIDGALDQLNDADREAILLRFFRGQSLAELSSTLGCSDNAARMRTSRALEKLRQILVSQGFTSSEAALERSLSAQSAIGLPIGLAASISAAAVSAASVTSTTSIGLFTFMTSIKTKAALTVLLIMGVTTPYLIQRNENKRLRETNGVLQEQAEELARLRDERLNRAKAVDDELARLRAQQSDLARLRAEVTALRRENEAFKAARPAAPKTTPQPQALADSADFIPAELWTNVGFDTPERAFQSFLAVLKTGDTNEIASTVHFDVQWKETVTEEDRKLVDKSVEDYIAMLERARTQLNGFSITSTEQLAADRQRIRFLTATAEGKQHSSSFEMINVDGAWKPVLSMRWLKGKEQGTLRPLRFSVRMLILGGKTELNNGYQEV